MRFNNPGLTILDFDGTYQEQPALRAHFTHRWVDFRDLRQTSLYCSLTSFQTIRRALPADPGVTLIGSGNFHYISLALLARLAKPFTLILVDHHPDSQDAISPSVVSCGSWVRLAFRHLPQLARVVMIGPPAKALRQLPAGVRDKIILVSSLSATTPEKLLTQIPTEDVYLSIDKDAFAPSIVQTNWDQGDLTFGSLLPFLDELFHLHKVRGADICGELPASPLELLQPQVHVAIAKNEQANERLLERLLHSD